MEALGSINESERYVYAESAEGQDYLRENPSAFSPSVFISHKHSDRSRLKGLLGLLKNTYGVRVYIDSMDSSMPKKTSDITAKRFRTKIKGCDRFILLATDKAVESMITKALNI